MSLNEGDILRERYQIIARLGTGGFGTTYKAYDNEDSDNSPPTVVIKEILISQTTDNKALRDDKYIERLELEAKTLKYLKHSCIPRFFEYFIEDNNYYIVQEYIEGQDLSQEIKPGQPIEEAEVIKILREILEILQFVHQKKIIHRDIKPSNIIRRRSDRKLFLIDFGAVKEVATEYPDASGKTLTTKIFTPGYAPCEQKEGMPNFSSDIYALGIMAMQAVTGFSIEAISKPNEVLKRDVKHNFVWEDHAPKIDSAYKKIISQMIKFYWKDRYQTVDDVLQGLNTVNLNTIILSGERSEDTEKVNLMFSSELLTKKMLGIGLIGVILGASFSAILSFIYFPWEKYEETKIDMKEACIEEQKKRPQFQEYDVKAIHSDIFQERNWSVFHWKCRFRKGDDIEDVGLNLDDYCKNKYENSDYKYEAYFKNFRDPNSWYCTRVGTKQ